MSTKVSKQSTKNEEEMKEEKTEVKAGERVDQLSDVEGYDVERLIISDPVDGSVPNSTPPIKFKRINISTRNTDGTIGDLIFPTTEVFSFGVGENRDPKTGDLNGYSMALVLWNRNGPTDQEKAFSTTFENVVNYIIDKVYDKRVILGKPKMVKSDIRNLNCLYWKRDEAGEIVPNTSPTLYVKLIESKKLNKILTQFFDYDGNKLEALSLLGKYCDIRAAVKIESVFFGAKTTLQVKLREADVRIKQSTFNRLMPRPTSQMRGALEGGVTSSGAKATLRSSEEDDDTGSVNGDGGNTVIESTTVVTVPDKKVEEAPAAKKTVRKITRVKA